MNRGKVLRIKIFIAVFMFILLISCATDYKRGPEGGPNDKVSPAIGSASIQNGTLNMDKNSTVEIKFSEFIDVNSAKNSIVISPRSASKKAKILWYDKSCKIKFKDLEEDQTVVITVNPSLKDTQGNMLSGAYSLSFSTGGSLDRKFIFGRINGAIARNSIETINYAKVKINLYAAGEDTIDISKAEPEYSTGLSEDLVFKLKNIGSGRYRILAFNDINNDQKPQPGSEMLGFSCDVIDLSERDSIDLKITLGLTDNESPFIKNTTVAGEDILKIELSEDIKESEKYIDSCIVNGQDEMFVEYSSQSERKVIYAKIKPFKIDDLIKVKLSDIKDDSGNPIKEELRVKTHTVSDTISAQPFRVSGKIPGKISADRVLTFATNSFVNDSLTFKLLELKDSLLTGLDKNISIEPYKISIDLKDNGIEPGSYQFNIEKADTTAYSAKILVEDPLGSGSVSGTISGVYEENCILICKNVKGTSKSVNISNRDYKIDLDPGKYILAMFADEDSNGVFSLDHRSFISEKAFFYADTVNIRKNWETSDINFEFK